MVVEDYDCDGNFAEDDDLGVTQGYKKKYVFCVIFKKLGNPQSLVLCSLSYVGPVNS